MHPEKPGDGMLCLLGSDQNLSRNVATVDDESPTKPVIMAATSVAKSRALLSSGCTGTGCGAAIFPVGNARARRKHSLQVYVGWSQRLLE